MRERFKVWRLGLCLTALGSLSACATVQVVPAERLSEQRLTTEATPVAHIYAANWGLYLFKYLPIITGSLSRPGAVSWPALFATRCGSSCWWRGRSGEQAARGARSSRISGPVISRAGYPTPVFWLNGSRSGQRLVGAGLHGQALESAGIWLIGAWSSALEHPRRPTVPAERVRIRSRCSYCRVAYVWLPSSHEQCFAAESERQAPRRCTSCGRSRARRQFPPLPEAKKPTGSIRRRSYLTPYATVLGARKR